MRHRPLRFELSVRWRKVPCLAVSMAMLLLPPIMHPNVHPNKPDKDEDVISAMAISKDMMMEEHNSDQTVTYHVFCSRMHRYISSQLI